MIHYQLRCDQGHEFDGWFKDSAGFERQAKRGLIECPSCGAVKVERALMAPHVPSKRRRTAPEIVTPAPVPVPAFGPESLPVTAGGKMPDHVRAMLQREGRVARQMGETRLMRRAMFLPRGITIRDPDVRRMAVHHLFHDAGGARARPCGAARSTDE